MSLIAIAYGLSGIVCALMALSLACYPLSANLNEAERRVASIGAFLFAWLAAILAAAAGGAR